MGYTLKIGELSSETHTEDGEEYTYYDCELVSLPDAPAFDEPTDHENQRWPSYTSWHDAMRQLDMMDLMFDTRNDGQGHFVWRCEKYGPLLAEHPGSTIIQRGHVEYAEYKLQQYKARHPDHIAQYPPPKPDAKPWHGNIYLDKDLIDDPRFDGALCRGEWLVYWLRWAFDNCKRPAFINS
jgi:hypothetical protein